MIMKTTEEISQEIFSDIFANPDDPPWAIINKHLDKFKEDLLNDFNSNDKMIELQIAYISEYPGLIKENILKSYYEKIGKYLESIKP